MFRSLSFAVLVILVAGLAQRSNASILVANTALTSAGESPPTSPGIGFAHVTIDTSLHTLSVEFTFSGLLGNTTASHIHAPTSVPLSGNVGVATQTPYFSGFPTGVTSGTYADTFDMTQAATWNAAFITAQGGTPATAEAALTSAIEAGKAYLNIHTNLYPGGEIRGFLQVPEPSILSLAFGAGLPLLLARRRTQH